MVLSVKEMARLGRDYMLLAPPTSAPCQASAMEAEVAADSQVVYANLVVKHLADR